MIDVPHLLSVKTYINGLVTYAYVTRYVGFKTYYLSIKSFKTNILLTSNLQFLKKMCLITHRQLKLE